MNRRDMTKGQKAAVLAQARTLVINTKTQSAMAALAGLTQAYISHAGTVLQFCPDLAPAVIAGSKGQ